MEFEKITDAELVGKGVTGLPDVPGLSTADMQAKFDELSKDVIIPKFNTFIDSLNELIKTGIVASDDIRKIRINAEGYLEYSSDGNSFEKPQNERGSRWSEGTAITGENTEPTVFPNSGIEDALKNDQYLNSQNGNLYSCTLGGTADIAQWVYSGNIKGDTPNVADDMTVSFEQASTRNNIDSGEKTKTLFGKIKKWFADMTAAAFAQVISSNTDLMANMVSGYLVDALAVKNQFEAVEAAKADKNGTEHITVTKDVPLDGYSFVNAPFVAQTTPNAPTPAGYGFHNAGSTGIFLYVNRADGNLRARYNDNTDYALFTERNMVAENVTADFVATNLLSFTALKYGNEIHIFFVAEAGKDCSISTEKWKPRFTFEYACMNYSGWTHDTQVLINKAFYTDGRIFIHQVSQGLLYAYIAPLHCVYYI